MVRQIVAIERGVGFLNAVRLQDDWIAELRQKTQIKDAMASVEIEGHSVTYERALGLIVSSMTWVARQPTFVWTAFQL